MICFSSSLISFPGLIKNRTAIISVTKPATSIPTIPTNQAIVYYLNLIAPPWSRRTRGYQTLPLKSTIEQLPSSSITQAIRSSPIISADETVNDSPDIDSSCSSASSGICNCDPGSTNVQAFSLTKSRNIIICSNCDMSVSDSSETIPTRKFSIDSASLHTKWNPSPVMTYVFAGKLTSAITRSKTDMKTLRIFERSLLFDTASAVPLFAKRHQCRPYSTKRPGVYSVPMVALSSVSQYQHGHMAWRLSTRQ